MLYAIKIGVAKAAAVLGVFTKHTSSSNHGAKAPPIGAW